MSHYQQASTTVLGWGAAWRAYSPSNHPLAHTLTHSLTHLCATQSDFAAAPPAAALRAAATTLGEHGGLLPKQARPVYIRLQAASHTVAASVTYGYSLPSPTVAGAARGAARAARRRRALASGGGAGHLTAYYSLL